MPAPLPAGFVLDDPKPAMAPVPQGFTLDQPPASAAPPGMGLPTEEVTVHPDAPPIGLWERAKMNAGYSWRTGTLAGAATGLVRDKMGGQTAADLHAADAAYEHLPSYADAPTFLDKVLQGGASLAGQVAGQIATPESFVALPEKFAVGLGRVALPAVARVFGHVAAPVATRIAVKGAEQAAINTVTDPAVQTFNKAAHERETYDPMQTALAPLMGFAVGGSMHGAAEMAGAFRAWRARNAVAAPDVAPHPDAPPTQEELSAFTQSPEMQAFRQANAITDPTSPLAQKLEQRVQARRTAEAHPLGQASVDLPESNIVGGAVDPTVRLNPEIAAANREIEAKRSLAAELFQGQQPGAERGLSGILQEGRDPSTVGLPVRQQLPDTIPVTPGGQADIGGLDTEVARDKFGARGGLPAIFQPDSASRVPMSPDEIAHRQRAAEATGGQIIPPMGEPGRFIGSEDRLPRTPEQQQGETQAQRAFRLKAAMAGRAGPGVRDVSPAPRPEGVNAKTVTVHQGFPVEVQSRSGKSATVQRIDPDTGQHVEGSIPYEAAAKDLTTAKRAASPRMATDFAERAQSPRNPEKPVMPGAARQFEPDQTYRATTPDPNEQFPGAGEGRSPMPEQPAGPHPGRERPTSEDEAIRDFEAREQARREGKERQYDQGQQQRGPRPDDNKTSTKAKAPDKDGRYAVDDRGFVASDKGGPMKFGDQKQAAKWIINEGHAKSPDQIFEIENHPSGKGFGVRERGRSEPNEPSPQPEAGAGGTAGARNPPGALPPPKPEGAAPKGEAGESPNMTRAREAVAESRAPQPKAPDDRMPMMRTIRQEGGIRTRNAAGDLTREGAEVEAALGDHPRAGGLINNRTVPGSGGTKYQGKTPEHMRQILHQDHNWWGPPDYQNELIHPGADPQTFYTALEEEARGNPQERVSGAGPEDERIKGEYSYREQLQRQLDDAGVQPGDSDEVATQKLSDHFDAQDREFDAQQAKVSQHFDDWSQADIDALTGEGYGEYSHDGETAAEYEPGADHGAEHEAAGEAAGGPENAAGARTEEPPSDAGGGAEGVTEGAADTGASDHSGEGADRRADQGSERGAKPGDEGAGRDRATGAEAKQQNGKPDLEQTRMGGTEHEATDAELRQRQAERAAEEKQQNPRAFKDRVQKGHDEGGLFGDQSEKAQEDMFAAADKGAEGQGTPKEKVEAKDDIQNDFFSNPVGDPRVWRRVGRDLVKLWGWSKESADRWVDEAKKNWADLGAKGPGGDQHWARKYGGTMAAFLQGVGSASDSSIRTLGWSRGTKVLGEAADLLHVPTKLDGVARKESYFDAVDRNIGHWENRVEGVLSFTRKMKSEEQAAVLTQIRNKITNPRTIRRGTPIDDAAAEITKVLAEIHPYLKDAGIDLGKVDAGYFPRVTNDEAILKNPTAFRKQAIKAYMDAGVPRKEAGEKADAWIDRVRLGDEGVKNGNEASSHFFTEARSLPKSADETLKDFLLTSPADTLPAYISRAVRKAEYARRYGKRDPSTPLPRGADRADFYSDPNGKLTDFEDRLIAEGNGDLVETLRHHIQSVTGNFGAPSGAGGNWRAPLSWAKTWTAISYLPKSIIPALSEPVVQAIQTGNTLDAARAYSETVRQWVPVLRKMGDGEYWRGWAQDLGYVRDAHDSSVMMARGNAQSTSLVPNRLMNKFYIGTGISQITEATRVSAVKIGTVMLRRLATDIEKGSAFKGIAGKLMADLGVPVEQHAAFSKWVLSLDKPKASDIRANATHGQAYQAALSRFVNRAVQVPNAALRPLWTRHPLGSVIFGLQSFNYAFTKNVLARVGTMALHGVMGKDMTLAERAFCMMPLVNTVPLMAASYAAYTAKDFLFQDPARQQKKPVEGFHKVLQVASRSGLTGMSDAMLNAVTSARYETDPLTALAGPTLKGVAQGFGHGVDLAKDPHNPTKQRKAATDAYNMVVEPGLIGGLAFVNPMTGLSERAAAVGMNYVASHPYVREHVGVRPFAGKRIE